MLKLQSITLKEFGGNLKPVFQKGQGTKGDKEIVTNTEYDLIPINSVIRNPNQPRKNFSENEIQELAESIRKQGVIQPVVVRPMGNNVYELIAGERRLRACKIVELQTIPALIREYDDKAAFFVALVENLQRDDLNQIEEAIAYKKLANDYSLSHEQIGMEVGKSRTAITNVLRLLSLEPKIQEMIEKNLLGFGHARALISLEKEEQLKLAERIVSQNLTVRDVERLVSKRVNYETNKVEISTEIKLKTQTFSERLTDKLSTKVQIKANNKWKGGVIICFESEDELVWLVNKIDPKTAMK